MKYLHSVLALGSALVLSACAQNTPYAPVSSASAQGANGYSSQMLSADRYRVMFSGNKFTSRATVENYLLYRAAELTRQQGYDGFTVMRRDTDGQKVIDVDRVPVAGVGTYSTFSPYYGFYGIGNAYTSYDPYLGTAFPTRLDIDRMTKYDAMAVIHMYRGAPPVGMGMAYNAMQVMQRLGGNIEMPVM